MNFSERFVACCARLCADGEHGDSARVGAHNRAMDSLDRLVASRERTALPDELGALLRHADSRARLAATSYCVDLSCHGARARLVLLGLAATHCVGRGKDRAVAFDACMKLPFGKRR